MSISRKLEIIPCRELSFLVNIVIYFSLASDIRSALAIILNK